MPVVAYEPKILTDVVRYELNRQYTREKVSFKNASGLTLKCGTVLGRRLANGAAVVTAGADNVGDGVFGAVTVSSSAAPGVYEVIVTGEASDAGTFAVYDPAGAQVGTGTIGVLFTGGGLSFTIADGTEDFDEGDKWTLQVTGGWEYDICTATATDGTANPAGIYLSNVLGDYGFDQVVAAATAVDVVILARGPAIVAKDSLVMDASINTAAEKNMVYNALTDLGILVSDQV